MGTEFEIIKNLAEHVKFGLIRTKRNQLVFMNSHALELFGYSSVEDVRGMQHEKLYADQEEYQHLLAKQRTYGRITNERALLKRKDQTNFWGLLTRSAYFLSGVLHVDEIIFDISEQVRNEHRLREKDLLLDKVANELDRFVYSASHDLRSPISSMKGLMTLMKMNPDVFDWEHFLTMMEESLDRLDVFISKLVEFSRNSHEPVVMERVDLNKIIKSILDDQQAHSNWPKVKVECLLPDSFVVSSDYNKVYTILSHVIRNSLDYSDVSKCSFLLSIKGQIHRDIVTLEIIDNGIGIEKKFMPMVFQMFFRATMLSKGSGLGLYLAREAINRLGGTITISSELNLGTLVRIQFPAEAISDLDDSLQIA